MKKRKLLLTAILLTVLTVIIATALTVTVFANGAETEVEITPVTTWDELLNAVNADKSYIQLTCSILDTVPNTELPTLHRLVFDGGDSYILDLNGYSLTLLNHANEYYSGEVPMIAISNGSSVEIKNGDILFENYYAKSNRQAKGTVAVYDTSSLTATKVNMKNAYSGTVVYATASADVTIDGGEYIVQNGFALSLDRQASLTLDGGAYIHTVVGDSTYTQGGVDGYGALFSESTGSLTINYALFKSGIQINTSQLGAFSVATHEVTINGSAISEEIFEGTAYEAAAAGNEYFWYRYNQNSLCKTENHSFSNAVSVISYDKKYPINIESGIAMVNGVPVTEAAYGETVTIVAHNPEEGMEFLRWDASGVTLNQYYSSSTTFTMVPSPVTLTAYYGKESFKTVNATVSEIIPGQKAYDTKITLANDVYLQDVEWREEGYLMDDDDIFKAGKTYTVSMLIYPPNEYRFDETITVTVNGKTSTVNANSQYAYINYTCDPTESVGFSIVYSVNSRLGIGGEIKVDTELMASQSASFKTALEGGKVTYQWYKNGEAIEGETDSVYNFTANDAEGRFYVVITADGKTNYGHHLNCGKGLYQLYLNASEIVVGGKVPQISSATPGVSINVDGITVYEIFGENSFGDAINATGVILTPGKRYSLVGTIIEEDGVVIYEGANVYVNGEKMADTLDHNRFFYEFEVPTADFEVYYKANGEIGIGATITVDTEKMCKESGAFKNAYDKANPTYQTVFYQWYKNGEKIDGATKDSYTVTTADKNSLINCIVTLVDGKIGVGAQQNITNLITVITVKMPYPKNGDKMIKEGVSADGVTRGYIFWEYQGIDMYNDDTYVEGEEYLLMIQFKPQDGFVLYRNGGNAAVAYIYGEKVESASADPGSGACGYMLYVTAIHKHIYLDDIWTHDEDYHWQPCAISGCPAPNEEEYNIGFHSGTEATCQTKGKCATCGYEYYGEHDISSPVYVYIDDMKCGYYCATEGCDYLAEWSFHTGGIATCTEKAVCEICHTAYGSLGDHTPNAEWKTDANSHYKECACGEKSESAAHTDENSDGICDICKYQMNGGENPGDGENSENAQETNHDKCREEVSGWKRFWNSIANFFRRLFGKPNKCVCGEFVKKD